MKRWTKRIAAAACALLFAGFVSSYFLMYRGSRSGMPTLEQRGRGVWTLTYGTSVHGMSLSLCGNGLHLERYPSAYSLRSPEDAETSRLKFEAIDAPVWNWCGTGRDQYKLYDQKARLGFAWTQGTWIGYSYFREPPKSRPHFSLTTPHWFNASAAGMFPLWTCMGWIRGRRRYGAGHCQNCGYDLRATPARCPECGTVPLVVM